MNAMKGKIPSLLICVAILCLAAMSTLFIRVNKPAAAAQVEEGQTLQNLLTEVHQLRIALQRNNLNTYRAQITVERMRVQQEQVLNVRRELESARNQLLISKRFHTEMADRVKEFESQLGQETDPYRRAALERQYRESKRSFESQVQWEEGLREREAQLVNQQQFEQAKLSELADRLDALEREIESQQPNDKQGKRP